jgi:hypothetical protein
MTTFDWVQGKVNQIRSSYLLFAENALQKQNGGSHLASPAELAPL